MFSQNPLDNTFVEARALNQTININNQLLEKFMNLENLKFI